MTAATICSQGDSDVADPIGIDPTTHDIVQNIYLRKFKKVDGKPVNAPIGVLKDVKPRVG